MNLKWITKLLGLINPKEEESLRKRYCIIYVHGGSLAKEYEWVCYADSAKEAEKYFWEVHSGAEYDILTIKVI
jgi:hypothetical protein